VVGRAAVSVAAAADHSCALFDDGSIKCWGAAFTGRLGSGDTLENLGDAPGEMGDALAAIELGATPARSIAAGGGHSCALLDDGGLRCWGGNLRGQLGLGDTSDRGDQPGEMGDALPLVDLGAARVEAVSAGGNHTCVLLDDGRVKCFGGSLLGALGNGAVTEIGEDTVPTAHLGDEPGEMGDALPAVDLGMGKTALAISAGTRHTCALLNDHSVKCWGDGSDGQLGLGDVEARGDEPGEMGDALPALDL
jgi:alpha-tubulin suppressor-like RCC1 family protein